MLGHWDWTKKFTHISLRKREKHILWRLRFPVIFSAFAILGRGVIYDISETNKSEIYWLVLGFFNHGCKRRIGNNNKPPLPDVCSSSPTLLHLSC